MKVPWGAPTWPFLLSTTASLGKVKTFLSEAMENTGGRLCFGCHRLVIICHSTAVQVTGQPLCSASTSLNYTWMYEGNTQGAKTAKFTHCVWAWFASIAFLRNAAQSLQGRGACCNQPYGGKYISLKLISLYGWILPSSWNFHKPVSSTLNLLIYFFKCKQLSNKILLHLNIILVMFCTFLLHFQRMLWWLTHALCDAMCNAPLWQ